MEFYSYKKKSEEKAVWKDKMSTYLNDLEKTINSSLATTVNESKINFGQLSIDVDVENILSTILFLNTNEKCRLKQ